MRREKVDRRVGVKNSLRPVAVMHVPVEYRDFLDLRILLLGVTRRHRDVVEKTETHRPLFRRVMSRWPHGNKSVLDFTRHDQVHRLTWTTGRTLRSIERPHG